MELYANIIGLIGVGIILAAYALLSFQRLRANDPRYIWLNLTGTCAVLYSVFYAWNWPGFMLNIIWVFISIYGLARIYRNRTKAQKL